MLTYGDGVSDVTIDELVRFHQAHGKLATLTAVQPGGRFGVLDIDEGNTITSFREKAKEDGGWINGGFMVLEPNIFDYLSTDENCVFEHTPLRQLSHDGQLAAYKHDGFWQCMDTQRDKLLLESYWQNGAAPWKLW